MKKIVKYVLVLFISLFIMNSFIYAYKDYKIGDEITYNDIKFHVIKDSSSDEDNISILKAEPLTVDEVNLYGGVGTADNHVNRYTYSSKGRSWNNEKYGGMAYYSSSTCGYAVQYKQNSLITTGCKTSYDESDIKYVVDAWTSSTIKSEDLTVDILGYNSRLITTMDLENLGYILEKKDYIKGDTVPEWFYNADYWYWTMSQYDGPYIRYIQYNGEVSTMHMVGGVGHSVQGHATNLVRPVITLKKSAIEKDDDKPDEVIPDDTKKDDENKKRNDNKKDNEVIEMVYVPNTLEKISIIFIMIGVILISVSIIIVVKNRR